MIWSRIGELNKPSWLLDSIHYGTILFSVIIFHFIIHINYGSGIIYKGLANWITKWYGMVILSLIIIMMIGIVAST
jgi:hypothetical protein